RLLARRGIKTETFLRQKLRIVEANEADLPAIGDLVSVLRRDRSVPRDQNIGVVLVELDGPLRAANPISIAGDEFARGVARERSVSRVAFALRRVDDKETVAADCDIERASGLRHRSLRKIGNRRAVLHERNAAVRKRKGVRTRRRGQVFLELNALALEA